MSALLTLDRLSLAAPDGRLLFSDLTLSIGHERVGLVGRNGAGKSTLLHAVAGEVAPVSGTIAVSGSIGILHQVAEQGSAAGLLGIAPALAVLGRIERGEASETDFEVADWTLASRVDALLSRIGLGGIDLDRPVAGFSGGERTRLGLARMLIDAPDLLLLSWDSLLSSAGRIRDHARSSTTAMPWPPPMQAEPTPYFLFWRRSV